MDSLLPNFTLIRSGLILLLISVLAAILTPYLALPRLALSAHSIGITSSLLLICLGIIWQLLRLPSGLKTTAQACWLFSAFANWGGTLVAAITGAGGMTPVAAGNSTGSLIAEAIVTTLLTLVVVTTLLALSLTLRGFNNQP